ncbi:MAG: hypothetical protein JRI66_12250, partial [Deltaproteobacteria bacterium]|nr:hypothetical protein [Deltaproteobacteria bacterium]
IPARLFFIGLWNFADDNGVLEYKPRQLKARIFPADNIDIEPLVQELENQELIKAYSIKERIYIIIVNFLKHQKIDRPRKGSLPLPNHEKAKFINLNEIKGNQMISTDFSRNQLKSEEIIPGSRKGSWRGSWKGRVASLRDVSSETSLREVSPPGPEPAGDAGDGLFILSEQDEKISDQADPPLVVLDGGNGSGPPKIGPQALVELWNGVGCRPQVSELTEERRKKATTRLRKKPDPEWWRQLFEKVRELNKPWLTFDFLMRNDTNALKVLEGHYDWDFNSGGRVREPPVQEHPPSLNQGQDDEYDENDPFLVPDPKCPTCRGKGLARDGPCKCLRPEHEVLAERRRDAEAETGADKVTTH